MQEDEYYGDQLSFQEICQTKISQKLYNDGYRIGKAREEERLTQNKFDIGLEEGIKLGKICGKIITKLDLLSKETPNIFSKAKKDELNDFISTRFPSIDNPIHSVNELYSKLVEITNSQKASDLIYELKSYLNVP